MINDGVCSLKLVAVAGPGCKYRIDALRNCSGIDVMIYVGH